MSTTPEFSIDRLVEPGGAVLLMPRGELDVLAAPVFRARVLDLLPERLPLIVDRHGLEFMDSSGLAALLELRSRARQAGWEVTVRGAHGRVRELLERTGTLALVEARPEPGFR
jgi:anti-sigma B factor antagonist